MDIFLLPPKSLSLLRDGWNINTREAGNMPNPLTVLISRAASIPGQETMGIDLISYSSPVEGRGDNLIKEDNLAESRTSCGYIKVMGLLGTLQ